MRENQCLFCFDCQELAAPACWGCGGDEHQGTSDAYFGVDGILWVVDENGSHGFWSYEPGTNDARTFGGFKPEPHRGLHVHGALRPGDGPTYRRYQPFSVKARG